MSWYPGNVTFASISAQSSQWGPSKTPLTAIFIALSVVAVLSAIFRSSSDDKIHKLNGFPFINLHKFFSRRHDFFEESFKKTGVNMFRFQVLQHRVIAMAGEANRKMFFNDRRLNMTEGYKILAGGIPNLSDIDVDAREPGVFLKQLSLLIRKERITEALPLLFNDVNRMMKDWGTEGKINPFKDIYNLVFQMTVRMASCRELSENKETVSRLAKHYWDMEKGVSAFATLLPWFPSPSRRAKEKATMGLYKILMSYVHLRRNASTLTSDPIDFLISQGIPNNSIVEIIMIIIFAGVVNTGVNACWALLHLGTNPKWKRKAIDEFKALVEKHTNTTSSDPLHTRLSAIPLEAWEDELPSLDLIIRETLRLTVSLTLFRRNLGNDIQAGEATIKRGDFLVYTIADVNLNPDVYTNPMTFDPDRYGPGREEDRKTTFGYLSWGAGLHPCAGMRIAKLEVKMLLAIMLLGYEYELVDDNGNCPKSIPAQDRNDLARTRPLGDPCYLKYKRIVE
ncbi:cytochrome P450 [Phlegmacium glaucopus]|nr:cytochrome P450 [Phlegmacium glaucopus]